jgi:hypothetical protein
LKIEELKHTEALKSFNHDQTISDLISKNE